MSEIYVAGHYLTIVMSKTDYIGTDSLAKTKRIIIKIFFKGMVVEIVLYMSG